MTAPAFARCRQHFADQHVGAIPSAVVAAIRESGVALPPGARVAITAGSRGIPGIVDVLASVVAWVKEQGGSPFLVPAMGSHGGATAEGQTAILAGLGITPDSVGCPIRASMDTVELPHGASPVPVYQDAQAAAADATIAINRIKPHTDFHDRYESGLFKMCAIGLGKERAASAIHALGDRGLHEIMPMVARQVLKHGNVALGIALVENACGHLHTIRAMAPERIADEEPRLLELARTLMPRLPVDDLDVLLVDRMGKEISGVGMDTNVVGRLQVGGNAEPQRPQIRSLVVHELTSASHGNATGMGLADVVPQRFADAVDFQATYTNVRTAGYLARAKLPLVATSDADAWQLALRNAAVTDAAQVRALRIRDTLHVGTFWASPVLLPLISELPHCEILERELPLHDAQGRLNGF